MFSRAGAIAAIAALAVVIGVQNVSTVKARDAASRDNIIDGTLYPDDFTPAEIKNGKYPRWEWRWV